MAAPMSGANAICLWEWSGGGGGVNRLTLTRAVRAPQRQIWPYRPYTDAGAISQVKRYLLRWRGVVQPYKAGLTPCRARRQMLVSSALAARGPHLPLVLSSASPS